MVIKSAQLYQLQYLLTTTTSIWQMLISPISYEASTLFNNEPAAIGFCISTGCLTLRLSTHIKCIAIYIPIIKSIKLPIITRNSEFNLPMAFFQLEYSKLWSCAVEDSQNSIMPSVPSFTTCVLQSLKMLHVNVQFHFLLLNSINMIVGLQLVNSLCIDGITRIPVM